MTNTNLPDLPFDTLPDSARQVATQAYNTLDKWIDDRVGKLRTDAEAKLTAATASLGSEISNMSRDLAARRADLDKTLTDVKKLQDDINFGDGQILVEAVDATRTQLESVQKELELYERRWKDLGAGFVNNVTSIVTGILK